MSDRITTEVDVTGDTAFISLNEEIWIKKLQKAEFYDRMARGEIVKGSRFDIQPQTKELCEYYKGLMPDGV